MGSATIKPSANIAIVWGTVNAVNAGMNGLLIETLQLTPKNGAPIDIESGAGFAAVQVGLKDGFDGRATAAYDSNIALLAEGANIAVVGPKSDGNAGTTNINCTFWSWSFTRGKKKESTIEIVFTHRPDING